MRTTDSVPFIGPVVGDGAVEGKYVVVKDGDFSKVVVCSSVVAAFDESTLVEGVEAVGPVVVVVIGKPGNVLVADALV